MNPLLLNGFEDMSADDVIAHIKEDYIKGEKGELENIAKIDGFDLLIAYESVGDWGCDSSSFFLFKRKCDRALFENHASHCSCFGFEGQFNPEETTMEYLKSDRFSFFTGFYDDESEKNEKLVNNFIAKM